MAQYRSSLPNFYSEKSGSYVNVGAIVPVLTDVNSDTTNNQPTYDPHYSYRGYLYCDGSKYNINDYPLLYDIIGNDYLLSGGSPTPIPDTVYWVNDPVITSTATFSGTASISPGSGLGEFGNFVSPSGAPTGFQYVAFGTPGTSPFSTIQTNRSYTIEIDTTGYSDLAILAIVGNDTNGGERPNQTDEGLQIEWPDGSRELIIPSKDDFNAANNLPQSDFGTYDATYATWVENSVTIPAQFRGPNTQIIFLQTGVQPFSTVANAYENADPLNNPNAFDSIGIARIALRGGAVSPPDERTTANSIIFSAAGPPGTIFRTFVDSGNVFAEIYGKPYTNVFGVTEYKRVIPNNAELTFLQLNDYPTAGGQVQDNTPYVLSYVQSYQSLAQRSDTHVYRILLNYNPQSGGGGSPGSTVTWSISSDSLLVTSDPYPILKDENYGTVPAIDPNTYDPLTGTGYPTGYTQYPNANNDTISINWANLSGMPSGVSVDTYEVFLEDLSLQTFVHWHVQNIPGSVTSLSSNQSLPTGATLVQNSVQTTSLGTSPDWVNNGYSGPQPPSGERHLYRLNVIANLINGQTLITHLDFYAGSGALIPVYGSPTYTDNYDITGVSSGVTGNALDVEMSTLTTQPQIRIRKTFVLSDYPLILGEFRVPDYRERKLIGFGEGVEGTGTPLVEDRITMNVGDFGGIWYIPIGVLETPLEFYTISGVITSGYSNVETQIQPYLIGEKNYVVGPIDDYVFSRPPQHFHQVLGSEVNESSEASFGGVDTYTTKYQNINGSVINFTPGAPTGDGSPRGHSHGLSGTRLSNNTIATYGNVDGIGIRTQSNVLPDISWDVTDPTIDATSVKSGVALINYGSGQTEIGGFNSPGSGTQYIAFGTPGTSPFNSLQQNRSVTYTLDTGGYEKFFILAIVGNDANGGERPNQSGEGLYVEWPDGTTVQILPSRVDFTNATGGDFQAYDATYTYWKATQIDIPVAFRNQTVDVIIKQTVVSTTGLQGGNELSIDPVEIPNNPNNYDSIGIAKIGLAQGFDLSVPWNGCYNYQITEPPSQFIASITSDGTYLEVVTVLDHGYAIGDTIIISATGTYDGAYTILADSFSPNTFKVQPSPPIPAGSGGAGGVVREAGGYFQESTVQPLPRVYVVDDRTSIGGKDILATTAPLGQLVYDQTITSGSLSVPANAGGSTNITGYTISMIAPGGGGGGSFGNGGNAGDATITMTVNGTTHTIYVRGGSGGSSGTGGGAGGNGGTISIPTALLNDSRFTFSVNTPGAGGTNGGSGGGVSGQPGSGGAGGAQNTSTNGSFQQNFGYVGMSSNSFNTNSGLPAGAVVTSTVIDISGGAGGNGNQNGAAGCSTTGGTGSPGRRLVGTYNGGGTFNFVFGLMGGQGRNDFSNNTPEQRTTNVGTGAANGGFGGRGFWGNGGSGGAGGGATSVAIGAGFIMGAGGGGGGGGSGGGNNGVGTTDPCWTGGAGLGPSQGTYAATAIGFSNGNGGGESGCTSGGGGGGGAGAGPTGGGSGGDGGVAGAGHVNTGSGSGGRAGRSAYNTNYITSVTESSGSTGNGYVNFTVYYTQPVTNPTGGGGGQGAELVFDYSGTNIATSIAASIGGAGSGGSGNGVSGESGSIQIQVFEQIPGNTNVIGTTVPDGVWYEVPGYPNSPTWPGTYNTIGGDIWHSSSEDVLVTQSTGSNFPIAAALSGGKSNRYILFSGSGDRFLQVGPLDLTNVNTVIFTVIKGDGTNGGESPEETLFCYYRTTLNSPSETLLEAIAQPSVTNSGWDEYSITIDSTSPVRTNGVYLVIRQSRPAGSGDNDNIPDGATNDNWGLAQIGMTYDSFVQRTFVPSLNATLPGNEGTCGPDDGINVIRRTVDANASNIRFTDGTFNLSASTPISVTSEARVNRTIPLITRYHRSKYLIKAF